SADGGSVTVAITHDALAYALNDTSQRILDEYMYALLDAPRAEIEATLQDARERFLAGFRITVDGQRLPLTLLHSPTIEMIDQWRIDNPAMRLPIKSTFEASAQIPPAGRRITFRAPV